MTLVMSMGWLVCFLESPHSKGPRCRLGIRPSVGNVLRTLVLLNCGFVPPDRQLSKSPWKAGGATLLCRLPLQQSHMSAFMISLTGAALPECRGARRSLPAALLVRPRCYRSGRAGPQARLDTSRREGYFSVEPPVPYPSPGRVTPQIPFRVSQALGPVFHYRTQHARRIESPFPAYTAVMLAALGWGVPRRTRGGYAPATETGIRSCAGDRGPCGASVVRRARAGWQCR